MTRSRDPDIRRALVTHLRERHCHEPDAFLRHEMDVNEGWRRVDVVLFGDEFCGYEIKSDADTLARLSGQAKVYGRVFDRMTLVSSPRHLDKAVGHVPRWWGIISADGPALEMVREPQVNHALEPMWLAALLYRDELASVLRGLGIMPRERWKFKLCEAIINHLSLEQLRELVHGRLRARWQEQQIPRLFDAGRWG